MPKPNTLHQFASFNSIFTLGVLTPDEVNMPDETYRVNQPQLQIFRSGGGAENKVTTQYEDALGKKLEYFIDNVEVEGLLVPNSKTRTTNATFISFEVSEPYSMGLFIQTLQIAATTAGYTNYLQAPYLLTVEFIGYDDDGDILVVDDGRNLKRMFPLRFTNIEFDVSRSGTRYQVECIPWNEQALLDDVDQSKNDIAIKGESIIQILQNGEQSLTTVLNGRYEELRKENKSAVSDEVVISFPNELATNFNPPMQPNSAATDQGSTKPGKSGGGGGILGNVVKGVVGGVVGNAIGGVLQGQSLQGAFQGAVQGAVGNLLGGLDANLGGLLTAFKSGDVNALFQGITGFLGAQAPQDFEAFLSMVTGQVMTKSSIGEGLSRIAQEAGSVSGLGNARIIESFTEMGNSPQPQVGQVYDKKNKVLTRAKNVISNNERVFQFPAGTKTTRIIEEVVLVSQWAKELKERAPDENGMVEWFKVTTETFIKPGASQEQLTGEPAKVYHYKVVPYMVHSSHFQKPADPGLNYSALRENAVKEYNYIYTGENTDIINFDIQINAAFFSAIQADAGQNNLDYKTGGTQNKVIKDVEGQLVTNEGTSAISGTGHSMNRQVLNLSTQGGGGAGIDNAKIRTARMFQDVIINSNVDLVSLDLEIFGDPYFIFDSGMGNYTAGSDGLNETVDGTLEYQRAESDIIVNFRTPVDYNEDTGTMDFPEDTIPVDAFSGLYRITGITNSFRGGEFKQRLKLLRRRNQPEDIKQEGTDDKATKVRDAEPNEKSASPFNG